MKSAQKVIKNFIQVKNDLSKTLEENRERLEELKDLIDYAFIIGLAIFIIYLGLFLFE